jgi:hypothetical protein
MFPVLMLAVFGKLVDPPLAKQDPGFPELAHEVY